ncbi:MAG: nitroreductase family deazaflavin-dependent oxidoreductase [Actinomycetota bacterium]
MADDDHKVLGMSRDELLAFNDGVAEEFRANGGRCGGMFEGNPMILVTMTGARSGRPRTTPLTYCADGDDCIVMASAGGSPRHPQWYFNLVANPTVTIERGAETYEAVATVTEGDDRRGAYDKMVAALPRFADYQAETDRAIPIFRLART